MIALLPDHRLWYALMIFLLSTLSIVVITFHLLLVVRGYKLFSTLLISLHALLFVFVLGSVFSEFQNTLNVLAYAAGVGTGNLLGIFLEGKLAIGYAEARIISTGATNPVASLLRNHGYGATETIGKGAKGPAHVTVCVIRRREIPTLQRLVQKSHPNCFITIESIRPLRKRVWPA